MAKRRVKIDDLGKAVQEILQEYGDNVTEGTKKAVLKVADIAKQETKAASPFKPGKPSYHNRHYRAGWAVREDVFDRFRSDAIVHNRTDAQRTHLLEKGHDVKNQKGGGPVIGHAPGHPHIGPAEQHAIKNLKEAVRKVAEGRTN